MPNNKPKVITTKKSVPPPPPPPKVKDVKSEGYDYPVPKVPFNLPVEAVKKVDPPSVTYMYEKKTVIFLNF